jgi:uncharacterized repeat protein (TIGR01451 family)
VIEGKKAQDQKKSAAQPTNKSTYNNNPSWWGEVKDWARQESSITDWCIAVFTLVLAGASIYQFVVIGRQLDVMRKDQRAWLKVGAQPDTFGAETAHWNITTGQPVTYPLQVINVGKTPARNVVMNIFMDIVDSSQEPPLDRVEGAKAGSPYPFARITAGIVFPNSNFKQLVVRPMKGDGPLVATDSEVSAIRDGKAYLAVYGIITYDDVFKTHHWTRFCEWDGLNGTFHTERCTKYNNVDDNQ